jgi:hypothetical protein
MLSPTALKERMTAITKVRLQQFSTLWGIERHSKEKLCLEGAFSLLE